MTLDVNQIKLLLHPSWFQWIDFYGERKVNLLIEEPVDIGIEDRRLCEIKTHNEPIKRLSNHLVFHYYMFVIIELCIQELLIITRSCGSCYLSTDD